MHNEPKHLDLLQNIEYMTVSVYREHPEMTDRHVINSLENLVSYYKAAVIGRAFSEPEMEPIIYKTYHRVITILEERKNLLGSDEDKPKRRSFSRALQEPTTDEISLACIRKIEKSARNWNQRKGERGYLNFVIDYLP